MRPSLYSSAQTISSWPVRMWGRGGAGDAHVSPCGLRLTLFAAAHSCTTARVSRRARGVRVAGTHGWKRAWITLRNAMFGVSSECRRRCPLSGHVWWPLWNHFSMQPRSYVWPVAIMTGSLITSMLIGQQKFAGGTGRPVDAGAGAAADWDARGQGSAALAAGICWPLSGGLKASRAAPRRLLPSWRSDAPSRAAPPEERGTWGYSGWASARFADMGWPRQAACALAVRWAGRLPSATESGDCALHTRAL